MASRCSVAKGSENPQLFKNLFELGVKHAECLESSNYANTLQCLVALLTFPTILIFPIMTGKYTSLHNVEEYALFPLSLT